MPPCFCARAGSKPAIAVSSAANAANATNALVIADLSGSVGCAYLGSDRAGRMSTGKAAKMLVTPANLPARSKAAAAEDEYAQRPERHCEAAIIAPDFRSLPTAETATARRSKRAPAQYETSLLIGDSDRTKATAKARTCAFIGAPGQELGLLAGQAAYRRVWGAACRCSGNCYARGFSLGCASSRSPSMPLRLDLG